MRATWLVTGGLGFIGSHFIRLVLGKRPDVHVINFDAMTYAGNPANLRDVERDPRYRFFRGDICDASAVDKAISLGVDVIVNFAAESHVDRSVITPQAFLRTNILGTHVLLQAARRRKLMRFLQVSTDEVYGEVLTGRSKETDPIAPSSPYSASKAGADLQVLAYGTTYGVPIMITRGSNTYGPYQHPEKLVPLFTTNLLEGKTVPLYGDGLHVRDWIHVEDHAAGILHALEHGEEKNIYNIGGEKLLENKEITARLVDLCGCSFEKHVQHVSERAGHDRRYALNSSKLKALGWRPVHDFAASLAATVRWYRENEGWWRPIKEGAFAEYYKQQYAGRRGA